MVMTELVDRAGLSDRIFVDSSATGTWDLGRDIHERTVREGRRRGYELTHKAKQFQQSDFAIYDYIIALDSDRADDLRYLAHSDEERSKISILLSYDPGADDLNVPDPNGYGDDMYVHVFNLIEPACEGLLKHIRQQQNL